MVVVFVNSNCWYDACGLEYHQRNAREINTLRGCIPTLARIEQAISEAPKKNQDVSRLAEEGPHSLKTNTCSMVSLNNSTINVGLQFCGFSGR